MQIKAAVIRAPQTSPVLETLAMTGPKDDEVLVRMVATGICHTDLKYAGSTSPLPKPIVLGHEGAGIVEAVGAGVSKVAKGDHVVLTFGSCGTCPSCRDAEPAYCYDLATLNFGSGRADPARYTDAAGQPVHGDFFNQSSFASHAVAQQRGVVKVRADAPLELLGPLGCGIQTGAGAVFNDFGMRPGQTLAVFGAGAVGLSAVMAARMAGSGCIVAIDRNPDRLALARELGADRTILADGSAEPETVRRHLPDGADFALDTTGVPQVIRQALEALAPRGVAGLVATPSDAAAALVSARHLQLGRSVRGINEGNSNPDVFIPMLVDFFMQGRFPFDRFARFYGFEEIGRAFRDQAEGTAVKPIIRIAA